jgi:hypothetical protein
MSPRRWLLKVATLMVPGFVLAGCFDKPPPPEKGSVVFRGAFTTGVTPMAFSGSRLNALSVDDYETYDGRATVRIDVPASSANPGFAGGVFQAADAQDLSTTTALTFWTKARRAAVLDKVGFGLAFDYESVHETTVWGLPLTTEWTEHVIPIADPSRLTAERGLFWFAESDLGEYSFWLADVKFDAVPSTQLDLQVAAGIDKLTVGVGTKAPVPLQVTYADVDGTRRDLDPANEGGSSGLFYFSFDSSDGTIATVDSFGDITGVAVGNATVTATLGTLPPQSVDVAVVSALPATPTVGAPVPTYAAADVKSLFSNSYTTVPGVTPRPEWSSATASTVSVASNAAWKYVNLLWFILDVTSNKIDASAMSYLHVDVWTASARKFGVKLVSFPASGGSLEATVVFAGRTTPPLQLGTWNSFDIPLSRFAGVPLDTVGQLLWLDNAAIGDGVDERGTFFVDNVYFHK